MAAVAALLAMAFTAFGAGRASADHPDCQFVLGFEAVQAAIPDAVGDCLENENHDPRDQITRQQTTGGTLVWHKATNWTGFTDGYRTWAIGPRGLQQRLSIERFAWEPASMAVGADTEADAETLAYVSAAIATYGEDGLEATVEFYNSEASIEGDRSLLMVDRSTFRVLAAPIFGNLVGATLPPAHSLTRLVRATPESGVWINHLQTNPLTGQREPKRSYFVLHEGIVFSSGHFSVRADLAGVIREYVSNAIGRYRTAGLDATIDHYNSRASVDGELYLFLMDADDIYLAHPIFPHLIGTDVKDVVGSNGYELGIEIAKATAEGHWVEYLWPNPVTGREEPKTTWVVRHEGLIFASGYYTPDPTAEPPAWLDADPREYTVDYVQRAIERYERDGLESMTNYYNSTAAFEGQFYLFAMDANDIYFVHPLFPRLIGTDIKDVVGSDGFELGKAIAQATEEGIWVEYLWPHPVTLQEAPKVTFAIRHDGRIFASGYYPVADDPEAHTMAYVQAAIDRYEADGLEATVAHYSSPASFDGASFLFLVDANDLYLVHPLLPQRIGTDVKLLRARGLDGMVFNYGEQIAGVTEEGRWFHILRPSAQGTGSAAHAWVIRHDGLIFGSAYFDDE
ncbi:MAG: cache domain-containing protein [Chloroflexi bacterium]|nr:cache domain-containing protein [Chloroflexota bacterium]